MLDWTGEGSGARAGQAVAAPGLLGTTRIATPEGWRPVETIAAGDGVVTFDSGVRTVRSVARRLVPGPGGASEPVLRLPEGLIGNAAPLLLVPDQAVMVESDFAEAVHGDPFALLPASALRDLPGVIEILPDSPLVVARLAFEADEIVFAEGQALVHCAGAWTQPASLDDAVRAAPPRYSTLEPAEARRLVAALERERAGLPRGAPRWP